MRHGEPGQVSDPEEREQDARGRPEREPIAPGDGADGGREDRDRGDEEDGRDGRGLPEPREKERLIEHHAEQRQARERRHVPELPHARRPEDQVHRREEQRPAHDADHRERARRHAVLGAHGDLAHHRQRAERHLNDQQNGVDAERDRGVRLARDRLGHAPS
jgi:hypothetical protein